MFHPRLFRVYFNFYSIIQYLSFQQEVESVPMTIEPMLRSLHPQGREQSEHKQMSTEDWHGLRLVGLSVYYTTPWKLNIEPKILEV